jgi:class 3 adenylate cyclase
MLAACRAFLQPLFRAHGGSELCPDGPVMRFVFGRASDALAAAVAARQAPAAPLRLRMALHMGEIEPGAEPCRSPAVQHAARLLAAGHPGEILVTEECAAMLRGMQNGFELHLTDLGAGRLTGADQPERLFQVCCPAVRCRFPRPNAAPAPPRPPGSPVRATAADGADRGRPHSRRTHSSRV